MTTPTYAAEPHLLSDCGFPRDRPIFPLATRVAVADFNNRFAGESCHIVGRGPTDFDYRDLAHLNEPIFFINDAIALEKYAQSETFFFAHDWPMRVWLDGSIRATAVLPTDGPLLNETPAQWLTHRGPVVFYRRREVNQAELLTKPRDEIAAAGELYTHSGTIHSVLHFIWYCGFGRVSYIGCDGINRRREIARVCGAADGYDKRLENKSATRPAWLYSQIRAAQDLMTKLFGIEAIYRGTPKL